MAQYLKNDCEQGFVTDNAEIENLKFNNMRHTVLGCMLGDFDAEGNYVVDPQIVKELIAMPKYIVDTVDNIDVCLSVIKLDRQITFFVTYEGEQAILTLAEKVNLQANFKTNSGLFSNINEYILDSYETSGVINKNAVYSKWNISTFAGNAMDVFNMDEETLAQYFGIVNRFKYLMKANQIMLENEDKLEEVESDYAVKMMQLIARYPELKKSVDAKLKDMVSKQPSVIRLDKPFFAKTVNEIINQTVEANISNLKPEEKQEFEVDRRNLLVEQNIKRGQVIDVINFPVLNEKQEVETEKCTINTNGAENRQSLTDIAAEYIVTKNQVSAKITQQAVAETLNPLVREKYTATTGIGISGTKQSLIDLIAKSTGQTTEQLGKNIVDASTNDVASTITKKHNDSQINLVARAAGVEAAADKTASTAAAPAKKAEAKKDAKKPAKKDAGKKASGAKAKGKDGDKKDGDKKVSFTASPSHSISKNEDTVDKNNISAVNQHAADTLLRANAMASKQAEHKNTENSVDKQTQKNKDLSEANLSNGFDSFKKGFGFSLDFEPKSVVEVDNTKTNEDAAKLILNDEMNKNLKVDDLKSMRGAVSIDEESNGLDSQM